VYTFAGATLHIGRTMSSGHYTYVGVGQNGNFIEISDTKISNIESLDKANGTPVVYCYVKKEHGQSVDSPSMSILHHSKRKPSPTKIDMGKKDKNARKECERVQNDGKKVTDIVHHISKENKQRKHSDEIVTPTMDIAEETLTELEEKATFYLGRPKFNQWWVGQPKGVKDFAIFKSKPPIYSITIDGKKTIFHILYNVSLNLLFKFVKKQVLDPVFDLPENVDPSESSKKILDFESGSSFVLHDNGCIRIEKVPAEKLIERVYIPKFGCIPFSFKPIFVVPLQDSYPPETFLLNPSDMNISVRNVKELFVEKKFRKLLEMCGPHLCFDRSYELFEEHWKRWDVIQVMNRIENNEEKYEDLIGKPLIRRFHEVVEKKGEELTAENASKGRRDLTFEYIREKLHGKF
jgi:hypothetical protein